MRRLATLIAVFALLAAPVALAAGTPNPVADCNAHATLTQHYSISQLRKGLSTMPADIREYTNCIDVLNRQLLAQLGQAPGDGNTSGSSSGGSFLPTPVIVILVLLILAAATFGAIALRRRRGADGGDDGP
jgi:hypothetical protein